MVYLRCVNNKESIDMVKILILAMAILSASIPVYAEDAQIGKDDFVSGAISDMFNKIEIGRAHV